MPPSSLIFIPNNPGSPIAFVNAGDVQVSDLSKDESRKCIAHISNFTQDNSTIILDQINATLLGKKNHLGFLRLVHTNHPGASIAFQHVSQSEENQDLESRNLTLLSLRILLCKSESAGNLSKALWQYLFQETKTYPHTHTNFILSPASSCLDPEVKLPGCFSTSEPSIDKIFFYLNQIETMGALDAQWILTELDNNLKSWQEAYPDFIFKLSRSKDFPHYLYFAQCQKDPVTAQSYGPDDEMLSMQVLEALVKKGGIECPYINQLIAKRDADKSHQKGSLLQQNPDPRIESLPTKDARIEFTIQECSNQLEETDRRLKELTQQVEALNSNNLIPCVSSLKIDSIMTSIQHLHFVAERIHQLLMKINCEVVIADTESQAWHFNLAQAVTKSQNLISQAHELHKTATQPYVDKENEFLIKEIQSKLSDFNVLNPIVTWNDEEYDERLQYFQSLDFTHEMSTEDLTKLEDLKTSTVAMNKTLCDKQEELSSYQESIHKLLNKINKKLSSDQLNEKHRIELFELQTKIKSHLDQINPVVALYADPVSKSQNLCEIALNCADRSSRSIAAFLLITSISENDFAEAMPEEISYTLETPDKEAIIQPLQALKDAPMKLKSSVDKIQHALIYFYPLLQTIHGNLSHYQTRVSHFEDLAPAALSIPILGLSLEAEAEGRALSDLSLNSELILKATNDLAHEFSSLHTTLKDLVDQRGACFESFQFFMNVFAKAENESLLLANAARTLQTGLQSITSRLRASGHLFQTANGQENPDGTTVNFRHIAPPPAYNATEQNLVDLASPTPQNTPIDTNLVLPVAPPPPLAPTPSLPRRILNSIKEFFTNLWNRFFPSRAQPTRNEIPPPYSERAPITNVPPPYQPQPPAYTP